MFELMRKQEETRQEEIAAERAHLEAFQSHADIVSISCFPSCHLCLVIVFRLPVLSKS